MALTPAQAVEVINRLYAKLVARRGAITKRNNYFAGKHPLTFASPEWRKYHEGRFTDFSDNWCGVVGRAAAERTQVFGVRLGDDPDVQSPDERDLWRDWVAVDGPAKAAQGYLTSTVTSTSYALVWGDKNGEPLLTWETPDQAIIEYDVETGEELYGLKSWTDDDGEYATLYTPDEIWKLKRAKTFAGSTSLILPEGVSLSVLQGGWTERDNAKPAIPNTLGVIPLVEYPNRPTLGSGPISDIDGTMAMQDANNLMWAYLFGAADFASLPARVVMGQEPPKMPILDANGQKIGEQSVDIEKLKHGRLLYLTGQNTTIGSWESARLDVFTDVINVMVKHIASQTQTPIHYIMGDLGNVNGETLTATELPLSTKVRGGHLHLTGPTRKTFRLFALVRDNKAVAEACRTAVTQWRNPETMSDAQVSDAASKDASIGWPFAAILERRYGLSQPEIARVLAQREAEATTDPIAVISRNLASGTGNQGQGNQAAQGAPVSS